MIFNVVGLVASVLILSAYANSAVTGNVRTFHQANAFLWVPVVVPSVLGGVWGASLLTTSFGLIGTYALVKKPTKERNTLTTSTHGVQ